MALADSLAMAKCIDCNDREGEWRRRGRCAECARDRKERYALAAVRALRADRAAHGLSSRGYPLRRPEPKPSGACDICGDTHPMLQRDHCHATKRPRGNLCNRCNGELARHHDSPDLLRRRIALLGSMIAYLEKHNATAQSASHTA